jgi:hypothetical protein
MARLISAKAQTAGGAIGSPQNGTKWVVKWAMVILHTGTGSGTRQVNIVVMRGNIQLNLSGTLLAGTPSSTATSANITGAGDVVTQVNTGLVTVYQQFPEVYAVDVIQAYATLISGDTFDYYVLVEEASS